MLALLLRLRPFLLAAAALAAIALASVVLYHSLETDRLAEKARQERFMRNAALSVVDDLGSELFTMVSTFRYDLMALRDAGDPIDRQAVTDTIARYRAQARFPDLLQTVVVQEADGAQASFGVWTIDGWTSGARPDWATDLVPPAAAGAAPPARAQTVFSLEKPVVTLYLRGRSSLVGEVNALSLRFSPTVILSQIVPTLVRQRFSESQETTPYLATVLDRSAVPAAQRSLADWEVPLLPTTPFDSWFDYYVNRLAALDVSRLSFEHDPASQDSGTGWALRVLRLPHGLSEEMTELTWRNLGWALGFFLVLTTGFLGLYAMARQSRTRAQQERSFLALVSHELKTPLAVVRSLSDNLVRGIGTDEARAREYGHILAEESERLSRMVGNVLGLTAVQGGIRLRDRSPIDLGDLVRDRLSRQDAVEGVEVRALIHPGLPPVLGHPAALSAAVDNLIGNAYRHGTGGRDAWVSVAVEPRKSWGRRGVELTVEDNGPGFGRFESLSFRRPFRRGRRAREGQVPGGGVGLSLIRATALALGGRLKWESRPGHGAKFSLWLQEARP